MLRKLGNYIEKDTFVLNINNKINLYNNIIVDSFVSNQCNLQCKHCYFLDYKPKNYPLSYERWQEIIKQCIDLGIKHFHFSGKEPFCDSRIRRLLSYLNSYPDYYNIFYGLVTNGTSINLEDIQGLLNTNLSYLEVSVEGMRNYNDDIRGYGHFCKIDNLLSGIIDNNKINLTSTIFDDNLLELISVINYFSEKGITKFNFSPFMKYEYNKLNAIKEIDSSVMLDFFDKIFNYLENKKSLHNGLDIRLCFTPKQCYALFVNDNILSNAIANNISKGEKIIYRIGNHILELSFPLINIPFMNEIVITHEGYVLSCADDIHFDKFDKLSLGNLSKENMTQLFDKRKQFIINYIKNI